MMRLHFITTFAPYPTLSPQVRGEGVKHRASILPGRAADTDRALPLPALAGRGWGEGPPRGDMEVV
jgi:hypothetical protein